MSKGSNVWVKYFEAAKPSFKTDAKINVKNCKFLEKAFLIFTDLK